MTEQQVNEARRTTSPTDRVNDAMRERRRLTGSRPRSRDGHGAATGAPIRRWSVAELIAAAAARQAD